MNENKAGANVGESGSAALPLSMAFGRADSPLNLQNALSAQSAIGDRIKIKFRLDEKAGKLRDCERVLEALLRAGGTPQALQAIDRQLDETRIERRLCDARRDAIDNNGPFNDPGQAADAALLAAIQTVDAAVKNTAALSALLSAIHGLVEAFPASST
jgi:hypothetical protein